MCVCHGAAAWRELRPAEETVYLECPCCGDDGAQSDGRGMFLDGQPLICGCKGHVSCDSEPEPPYIWADDCDVNHDDVTP